MGSTRAHFATLLALSLALAACSKKDSPTGTTGTTNNGTCASKYAATVNGASWCALSALGNYYPNQQQVVFTGVGITSAGAYSLTVSVSAITTAGTYALTSVSPLRFALAALSPTSGAASTYATTNAGSTGSVTFTTFSTTHVVGTFTFSATASAGSTGTLAVTNGSFDLVLVPGR